jgi:hypothetical protein
MSGIVYLFTNPAMPGLVKIGKTGRNAELRLSELSRDTGVPLPFECELAMEVDDMSATEKAFHQVFAPYRINKSREFFEIDLASAEALLRLVGKRDVTPEIAHSSDVDAQDRQASEVYKKKRPVLTFKMMGIEPGSELVFTQDEKIKVEVISERQVSYEGKNYYLSAITQDLLGLNITRPSPYWKYEDRILRDIQEEMYTLTD